MSDLLRLNLGAGKSVLPAPWINVDAGYDAQPPNDATLLRAWECYPLSFPDDSCIEVRSSHLLEHFPHAQTLLVLQEWVRVLAPGGLLRVAVPDLDYILDRLEDPACEEPLEGYLMGGQQDERDFHKAIFDRAKLTALLQAAGLEEIEEWKSELGDCASLPVSLNLQGRKPDPSAKARTQFVEGGLTAPEARETVGLPQAQPAEIRIPAGAVKAVLCCPRLGFTDNARSAFQAFPPLGIEFCLIGGVFWNQSMAGIFQGALEEGRRYLITTDYDSVYTKADVLELIRLMEVYPRADAICALQARRENDDSPLFTVERPGEGRVTGPREVQIAVSDLRRDLLPIASGHFGLTIFRVSRFADVPKPWFHALPDEAGEWGGGRTDADIAWWRAANAAGLRTFSANRVVIGHLQMLVSWPGQDLRPVHQYLAAFNRQGKPSGAWR